jgi:hypothetical protein
MRDRMMKASGLDFNVVAVLGAATHESVSTLKIVSDRRRTDHDVAAATTLQ